MSDRQAERAAERYRAALPPGELEAFGYASVDRIGVPVWTVTHYVDDGAPGPAPGARGPGALDRPERRARAGSSGAPAGAYGGNGYGTTDAEALTGALGELSEVVHAARALRRMPRRVGSYADVVREAGPDGVANPLTLCLEAGTDYSHDRPLQWVEATRFATGEAVLVPLEFAACQPSDVEPGDWLVTLITNGLGAGLSREGALGHGLLELVQRDGNNLAFRALDPGVALDLDAVADPDTAAALERLRAAGVDVVAKLASTDFAMANVFVVGDDASPGAPIMLSACGEAAHPDRDVALRKALLEFAAARARKAFTHGPLDAVERAAPPGYLERYRASHTLEGEEPRALSAMVEWVGLDAEGMRALLADTVLAVRSRVAFSSLPSAPVADRAALARLVADRLGASGLDVLYVDYTAHLPGDVRDRGVHAVKAIVPGMEVETMSYGRIGERGVRRLLERGPDVGHGPLAGVGPPPRNASVVPLTRAAVERLGGPAWLDRRAVERTVGQLYPLYREPGRHSAQLLLERRRRAP